MKQKSKKIPVYKKIHRKIKAFIEPFRVFKQRKNKKFNAWLLAEMQELLTKAPMQGKPHSLPGSLIVSLTSYSKRFDTVVYTLYCLLQQTVKADRIILWIAHEDIPLLPQRVLDLQNQGIEILPCEDLRSYTKIIHTLTLEPDAFIVTADDDIYYPSYWLEKLTQTWNGDYNTALAWRVHYIRLNKKKNIPLPYKKWKRDNKKILTPSKQLLPTGVHGVLYPPHIFHAEVLNKEKFLTLAPTADDIWLYWMIRLKGNTVSMLSENFPIINWPDSQVVDLYSVNVREGYGNDQAIENLVQQYGFPL